MHFKSTQAVYGENLKADLKTSGPCQNQHKQNDVTHTVSCPRWLTSTSKCGMNTSNCQILQDGETSKPRESWNCWFDFPAFAY